MVLVPDYLKKLLFQYDCIVVPELGGFILHYIPATFVESTGLYMPPRKKIAFNEALKLDDGLLINYLMLHESCTRDEAYQAIRQFVEGLKQDMRQQRIVTIEGLGLFSENEEGKLQFDPEIRHNFQGESYGFQPVEARLLQAVSEEDVKPAPVVKLPNESPIAVEAEEIPAKILPIPTETSYGRRQYLAWAAAVLLICSLGFLTVGQSPSLSLSSLNPFQSFMPEKSDRLPEAVKTETVTSVEPVAIPESKPEVVTEPMPVIDPVVTTEAETVKPPVVEAVAVDAKKAEVYYVAIAGSFSNKTNARRLMRKLRKNGFETAYVLPQSKTNELVKVAAVGSPDKHEILASLEVVSKLSGARAWVHKIGQ
ncbi:SPOR domain-containing protein [Larkinella bovis]|uniref:SPOR domain-containing protein n=1 Tax=Larkinella bovis TaxID=683041 RepID=A0ABW0IAD9_9BACT